MLSAVTGILNHDDSAIENPVITPKIPVDHSLWKAELKLAYRE